MMSLRKLTGAACMGPAGNAAVRKRLHAEIILHGRRRPWQLYGIDRFMIVSQRGRG
jgi:hypothetical protein